MSENRQPKGIPAGGQFAPETHTEPDVDLQAPAPSGLTVIDGAENEVAWDTPEDQGRYLEAAYFMEEAGIEGTVKPLYTKYRSEDGLDALILQVDGRRMTVHHVGTEKPSISYGDDEDDAWTFRMEAGDGSRKNEHEILHDLVVSARHDAACQEAWRRDPSGETFQYGDDANVRDFGVRYANNGDRIITVDIDNGGRQWELLQRGDGDVHVFVSGTEVSLPHIQLDALAYEFDEDHIEGTGDIRWKFMMKDAAERAAKEPGYNPRGINRP
ncbi:hypothetical protein Achl_4005 (plasmid) [Pseudarthrobacter chlorophenolicus A6]|uniref:Uncharacterized protein n=1 Tax=Pseudarthrobacter chlorophenolicus (strain ATCC 700700 / DSM 12829 / CIP 107037 / JCM 12360 / KCTC 9906 / NCIMB 13794 / A6) TaxID=452863 RepID=B8HHQ9_PSECP|nr:hypothetical protein [Pseudarthrobacter chlorophenolicus]ACL41956.1 hypothetical protein Achl_4005 [Pseudarthrobacter chlorophenolicus A6]SDQ19430.1 hypothetical protein SAMN04489738_0656 [Pseudarthrobacter chlorophenolicus]